MLQLTDVSVSYGPIQAVRNVSATVEQGEIVALLGPNGAGKTSLVSSIVGIIPVSSGSVGFDGEDITRTPVESIVRKGLTLTPEGRRVFAGLSVAENLRLGASTQSDRAAVEETLETYLEMFPILRERYHQTATTLSGGEQQMLAIARSLMSRPRMLMLDEPSLGLAPRVVERIFEHIVELKQSGLTMLVVEQNATEALAFADRAYVLASGKLVFEGAASELASSDRLMEAYLGTGVD
ncbi:ABC transporter ATP-binding protein [Methyloligella sp. 2.7D]|uniref:ABC transporter ATP-binding protein n=1 Tax=unclassified Methyloligella TaxID=2625955 RepID=UPI00157CC2E0|nr:ABC transporter ATP-binding protein [Methyloligella sp. GL2]QKP77944.1 ABC transporter ATP-binding protein [Methyloligella sp. GL2]